MLKRVAAVVLCLGLASAMAPGSLSAQLSTVNAPELPVCVDSGPQLNPAVHGNTVVWNDGRNRNSDIYMRDLTTDREFRITTNASDQWSPDVWGNLIVWQDRRNGANNWDIYAYDHSTHKEKRITTNTANQVDPHVCGDKIVWEDWRNGSSFENRNSDIYLYDVSADTEQRITTSTANQTDPDISVAGTDTYRIAYEDDRNGNADIYAYNLKTGQEQRVTTNSARQIRPSIYRDNVVWEDYRNGPANPDIYLGRLFGGTERRLCSSTLFDGMPKIWGSKVVWTRARPIGAESQVVILDMTTGRAFGLGHDGGMPDIFQNTVVWMDRRNGNFDIYGSRLWLPASLTMPSVPGGTVTKGHGFYVLGSLRPKHSVGGESVSIQAYRLESGKWRLRRTFAAKNDFSPSPVYTPYFASIEFPYTGYWRIRAYHCDAEHAPTYSAFRRIRVPR